VIWEPSTGLGFRGFRVTEPVSYIGLIERVGLGYESRRGRVGVGPPQLMSRVQIATRPPCSIQPRTYLLMPSASLLA
jgi:hypothetical protein